MNSGYEHTQTVSRVAAIRLACTNHAATILSEHPGRLAKNTNTFMGVAHQGSEKAAKPVWRCTDVGAKWFSGNHTAKAAQMELKGGAIGAKARQTCEKRVNSGSEAPALQLSPDHNDFRE
ncbi:hypothetical protein WMY93_027601 [Mugilogobius chulae]|uniref:Uncharacterized protein n=1 Tax=Mugilogobius chulae TaxID=88201 RepID=A0AAW0N3M4_9GOBI